MEAPSAQIVARCLTAMTALMTATIGDSQGKISHCTQVDWLWR